MVSQAITKFVNRLLSIISKKLEKNPLENLSFKQTAEMQSHLMRFVPQGGLNESIPPTQTQTLLE